MKFGCISIRFNFHTEALAILLLPLITLPHQGFNSPISNNTLRSNDVPLN